MRGLYAIVDPEHCAGRDPRLVASEILKGGCAALQLRDKQGDDAAFLSLGHELRALCRAAAVPFIVNDRVHLQAQLRADGVHVGQLDAPLAQVRALLGPRVQIGVSTHSLSQALQAERSGADLLGFGPVFATATKTQADPVVGLAALREVRARVRPQLPIAAIGGITLERIPQLLQANTHLAAMISALCTAADPCGAAMALHAALSAGGDDAA